ncbi:MAG: ribonucleotide-diphosphate reductase subunit beta [Bacillota bacterium]
MEKRKLYDVSAPNKSTKIIEGNSSNILNWNDTRFPWAYPTYKNQRNKFWIPDSISMVQDTKDWPKLSPDEQDAFLKVIGLLAFLDSVQTDFSSKVAEYITDSSVSTNLVLLSYMEAVHNESYSYVLSSLVPLAKQNEVFEYWKHNEVLRERNDFIAKGYEEFTANPTPQTFYKAVVLDVILEGLFFYSGFAFFYNIGRSGRMLGTTQMLNYINRDEQIHVGLFANIFKALVSDFPELDTEENRQWAVETIRKAAELEIKWSEYIIGSKFDGIDKSDMSEYVRFIANQRAVQLGLERPFSRSNRNPLPWIKAYEDVNQIKSDFFESKPRTYSKASADNGFDEL